MNDKKILFFDIDGTLITDDKRKIFPEDAKEALRLAKEKGHLLFINTGRVRCNVEDYLLGSAMEGLVCGCGTYISYQDKVLFRNEISQEVCKKVAHICRKYGIVSLFEYTDYTCYDDEMDWNYQKEIIEYFKSKGRKLISDIESPEFKFDKFSAWYHEDSDIEAFKNEIAPWFEYIDREGNFCEMPACGFSKATGIKYLLDYFDIAPHNAYVFGDSNNDIPMLSYVQNSICLGNGSEDAKKAASYVTSDVLNGGIFNAMKHFEII